MLEPNAFSPEALTPAVARVAGPAVPPAARMMAARGMAPLPPRDLVTALFQLSFDTEAPIAAAAQQTLDKLPDGILGAALGDDQLDPIVLEFVARRTHERPELVETILLNPRTHDQTVESLAAKLKSERQLDIIAGNQQRLLRHPRIIEALYFNKAVRMSLAERLVEFAVRNNIELDAIPQFAEIKASLMGQPEPEVTPEQQARIDQAFAAMVEAKVQEDAELEGWSQSPDTEQKIEKKTEQKKVQISELSTNAKIRLANLGSVFDRMVLIKDRNRLVSMATIRSPALSDQEVARYASQRELSDEVIRFIADRREWMKNYGVKLALVNNPKCPLTHAMRFLTHLRQKDLQNVARSKNVPAALTRAAKQTLQGRQ